MIDTLEAARRLLAEGRANPAIAMLERLAARSPARDDVLDLLAESNMRVSRFDSASRLLRPLIGARPGDVNRALLAAAALVRGGDDAAALAVIERLTRHAPSAQAGWMELSVLQRRLARFDEAIASARHAVALD